MQGLITDLSSVEKQSLNSVQPKKEKGSDGIGESDSFDKVYTSYREESKAAKEKSVTEDSSKESSNNIVRAEGESTASSGIEKENGNNLPGERASSDQSNGTALPVAENGDVSNISYSDGSKQNLLDLSPLAESVPENESPTTVDIDFSFPSESDTGKVAPYAVSNAEAENGSVDAESVVLNPSPLTDATLETSQTTVLPGQVASATLGRGAEKENVNTPPPFSRNNAENDKPGASPLTAFGLSKADASEKAVDVVSNNFSRLDQTAFSKASSQAQTDINTNLSGSVNLDSFDGLEASLGLEDMTGFDELTSKSSLSKNLSSIIDFTQAVDPVASSKTSLSVSQISEAMTRVSGLTAQSTNALSSYSTNIGAPLNSSDWTEDFSQKIVWLAGREIKSAEIHINPPELGPVEVKITVQNDQTTVNFNAQHSSVRELLESNVYRLREMFNANGVELADVNVGANSEQQSQEQGESESSGAGRFAGVESASPSEPASLETEVVAESEIGLVDYYA